MEINWTLAIILWLGLAAIIYTLIRFAKDTQEKINKLGKKKKDPLRNIQIK